MLSIVYLSTASHEYSDGDLAVLLMNSRANNRRLDLTGILLYKNGEFMQLLEGPDAVVRERYAIIAADPRHTNVKVLAEDTVDARKFPDWTMGYQPVTDEMAKIIPGFDTFFTAGKHRADVPETATKARWLLEWFRDHDAAVNV